MKIKPIVLLLALSLSCTAQAGAINSSNSFDYAYQMYGSSRTLPIQVFDDGKYTYLEVSGSNLGKLTVQYSDAQVITVTPGNQDGEGFIRLPGIFPSFHVRGLGLNAEIAYMGFDKRTLSRLVQLPPVPSVPKPTAAPVSDSASSSPEFSGSFVIQFLTADTSAMKTEGEGVTTTHAQSGIPREVRNTRKVSVRFGGDAVQASRADRAKIQAAARSAVNADTLAIRAFSGAADADTRKRYIARRAENVKAALVAAGVPATKIRLIYGATDRAFAPKAEIEFFSDSSHPDQPHPLLTQVPSVPAQGSNPDGRLMRVSMQVATIAPVVGGLVVRRLALSLGGLDIGQADRTTIAMALADAASCDTLIVRGYSDLPDPEVRMKDANLRARKAVAALVAAGVPEEKIRFAPVSRVPKSSSPRADIVFIRNGTGVSV